MSRSYSDRLGMRFTDDVKDSVDTLQNRRTVIDGDDVTLALDDGGIDFDDFRDDWDIDVGDVRASPQALYVDVTVLGRNGGDR